MALKYTDKIPDRICRNCGLKVCTQCEIPKYPSEFYRDGRANDGLQSECKECNKKRGNKRLWVGESSEKKSSTPNYQTRFCPACQHKTCGHCLTAKLITEFRKLATSKDGYDQWCRSCTNAYRKLHPRSKEYHQNYYAANIERQRTIQKAYRERHKEKEAARKKAYVLRKRVAQQEILPDGDSDKEET